MGRLEHFIKRFWREREGNFALKTAVLIPMLLAAGAGGMDFNAYNQQRSDLQNAVDAAALASVKEAALKGWTEEVATSIAQAVLDANTQADASGQAKYTVKTNVDAANRTVEVVIAQDHYPYFGASFFPSPQISVKASASSAGSANICVIGLDETRSGTVGLQDEAILTAPKCAVYSNSIALDGLYAITSSKLNAQLACSAGGSKRTSGNFTREPVTNCPKVDDPLSSRPAPVFSGCDQNNLAISGKKGPTTLSPGVYCGGLSVAANASITLDPGVYIMKDGPLSLGSNASIYGRDVGFYFTGTGADFSLQSGSAVDLEAPRTGPLAGLLFYQAHGSPEADFLLRSNKASTLVGTIYLPNGNFIIDTESNVADASAYTAIVARSLSLKRAPNVVLNTDYDATTVPVPAGIGPQGTTRLVN